jgi:TetR/AcrR family transcriptional regulator, repressor of fatR-cypB operon
MSLTPRQNIGLAEAVEQGAGKREKIMQAALDLFCAYGYHGTAMPLVAEKAGVGAGTIYRYFQNKEALVNELFQHWKTVHNEIVFSNFPFDAPHRVQFHEFWTRVFEFRKRHPKAFEFIELHNHRSYLDEKSQQIEDATLQIAYDYFNKSAPHKIFKPLPAQVLMAIIHGIIVGLVQCEQFFGTELTQENIDGAEVCCWEAIRL